MGLSCLVPSWKSIFSSLPAGIPAARRRKGKTGKFKSGRETLIKFKRVLGDTEVFLDQKKGQWKAQRVKCKAREEETCVNIPVHTALVPLQIPVFWFPAMSRACTLSPFQMKLN